MCPRVALRRCIGHRDVMIDEDYDDEEHYSKDRGAHGAYGVYPTQATNVFGGYRGKEIAYHPRYFSNFMPQRRLGYRLQVGYIVICLLYCNTPLSLLRDIMFIYSHYSCNTLCTSDCNTL